MSEQLYSLWAAVERSPGRIARAKGENNFSVVVSQLTSGRYMLEYGVPTPQGGGMTRDVPLMNKTEVEEEMLELATPFYPGDSVWEPLNDDKGIRRDEDNYDWSVKEEEDEARKE